MEPSPFEQALQWAGGLLALVTLGLIFLGVGRGAARPVGRQVGRFPRLLHSAWFFLVASLVFFAVCILLWQPIPLELSTFGRGLARLAGAVLYFPGMGLVLWGRLALGRDYYVSTGMGAQLFPGQKLQVNGPFAIVRHPMYTGLCVAALGGLFLYQVWTMVILLLFPFGLVRRARREEEALSAEFGPAWQDYCARVPAFFPRLRRSKGAKDEN